MVESTKVERRGCGTVGDLGLWKDDFIPGLQRISAFIKAQNATPAIQHHGRRPHRPCGPGGGDQGGRADMVAPARELLYNPNWALDAAQKLAADPDFTRVPPAMGFWLGKRARSAFEACHQSTSGQ